MHGRLEEQTMRELFSSPSFDRGSMEREYCSRWSGARSGSIFGSKTIDTLRKVVRAEFKKGSLDEKEFYAIYLMTMSDHKSLGNDYQKIIKYTIEWLEDDDVKRPYSEKVCAYLDSVVLGKTK
jgi:predicted phosphoadenosine phosphosulfate sulfurtransferase